MSVFNKRNALVGYLALKVAKRAARKKMPSVRKKRRSVSKIVGLGVLGLVSMGILAALAVVLIRRQRDESRLEGSTADEKAGEQVAATPEPIPAA
jgi:hypothetical protein